MDIRIDVDFYNHIKTKKLERRCGPQGSRSIIHLWIWAAQNRPSGDLSGMTDEDIEIAADWRPGDGALVPILAELNWLDGEPGAYCLHDWREHNPWAADADNRRDRARFSKLADVCPQLHAALSRQGVMSITKADYERLLADFRAGRSTIVSSSSRRRDDIARPSPSPAPAPVPAPIPFDKKGDQGQGGQGLEDLEQLIHQFPGYFPTKGERAWLEGLLRRPDIFKQLRRLLAWIGQKRLEVKNARAFITSQLK